MSDSRKKLYEGKAKIVWDAGDPETYVVEFKDDATAFDGKKRGQITGKGLCNNRISGLLFELLEHEGVPTHFAKTLNDREMLVRRLDIIPVEVVIRNVAAGSLAKRLGVDEGVPMGRPVLEFYYKSDSLGDPMVNRYHVRAMNWASDSEMDRIEALSLRVNEILSEALAACGLRLVDFKLEFGRAAGGAGRAALAPDSVLLGDEISPDTCRFWDLRTNEKLDKDRFRRDLGGVEEAYQEVLRRVTVAAASWGAGRAAAAAREPVPARRQGPLERKAAVACARVFVTLKKTVLDPQGVAVENALKTLGYGEVKDARVGKFITLELEEATPERIDEMCRRLLANPVIEDYRFELTD